MSSLRKIDKLGDPARDATEVAKRNARTDQVLIGARFEEVYPRYEFSELVRLGLALASWIGRRRRSFVVRPDLPPPESRTAALPSRPGSSA